MAPATLVPGPFLFHWTLLLRVKGSWLLFLTTEMLDSQAEVSFLGPQLIYLAMGVIIAVGLTL